MATSDSTLHRFSIGAALATLIYNPVLAACPDLSGAISAQPIVNDRQIGLVAGLVDEWKSEEPVRIIKFGGQVSKSGRRVGGPVYVQVETSVDATGKAFGARVVEEGSKTSGIDGSIASRVESFCFLPGSYNGKATEMSYSESFATQ